MIEFLDFIFLLDFASDDVNKNLQAFFSCPKKWRLKSEQQMARIEKHSLFANDEDE
jgi:hypothetical protein